MGAKSSRPAAAAAATPSLQANVQADVICIESNELVASATHVASPASRALATADQCLLGLSDACAQLLLAEALSPQLLRAALQDALADLPWFAGRLVLRQDGAFDVACCNAGARLVIASSSATVAEVAAAISPPLPPAMRSSAAAAATAAATAQPSSSSATSLGAAAGAAAAAAAGTAGFAAVSGDRSGGADPWAWKEFAMPRDPMAIVQDQLPLASVYLLLLRGGGCVLTLTAYHGMADFESLQTFAAHLSAAYNRRLAEEHARQPPPAAAAAPASLARVQQQQQQEKRQQISVAAAAAAPPASPHVPPTAMVEVVSRCSSKPDLQQPSTQQQQQQQQQQQPPTAATPAAAGETASAATQQPATFKPLPLPLLQPPEGRRSPRFDPDALEGLAAAELPPGVPPRERTHAPGPRQLAAALQRVVHEVAVRGGGKERRLFHVPAARLAELKAQATAELAQERGRAVAAACGGSGAKASSGQQQQQRGRRLSRQQAGQERQQLQLLRDVRYVSTKDAFVARLLQMLHSVPLRRGTPLVLLQTADMRSRVVADGVPVADAAGAAPAPVEAGGGGGGGAAARPRQLQPLPVAQLGNVLNTARVDGLRASEQSLGWAAGLLRHSLTRYAPAQYRRKLHEELQLVGAHGGRGLMYEFVLERRRQYNMTAVEGPVLVSCWEVKYGLWRFGSQLPLAFRSLGDSGPNTAVVVPGPPDATTAGGAAADGDSSGNGAGAGGCEAAGAGGGGLNVALTLHRAVWAQLDALWRPSAGGGGLAAAF
ncbi:hypothetical protein HXX76_000791 [Chlamydomonas incerta]|uniref:Uncharacterized protein n=1 Tax=Chlamydomonas incerta TaxID=51695 RepID=A0A836B3C0_CHLIN|nr:hypothetical protein HXX76_000791 [Chlamydomonas incerta]|eukprot:KAG2446198.1 hypothetical protein HXX76_000791 [Chlamydomonas incerta]